jgi:hypothetical protein
VALLLLLLPQLLCLLWNLVRCDLDPPPDCEVTPRLQDALVVPVMLLCV